MKLHLIFVLWCVACWSTAHGQLMIFSGFDEGINHTEPRPNADAARDAFLAAVTGSIVVEDFEGFSNQSFDSLEIANGTITSDGFFTSLRDIDTQFSGHNTTIGGGRYMHLLPIAPIETGGPGANLLFEFDTPISEFGFYGTGISTDPAIGFRILINGENADVIDLHPLISAQSGGVGFFGLIDPGNSITEIVINQFRLVGGNDSGDLAGLDDFHITSGLLLGDVNMDGDLNLLDVAPFIALVSSGEYLAEADINGDGSVNLLDVGPFVALLSE